MMDRRTWLQTRQSAMIALFLALAMLVTGAVLSSGPVVQAQTEAATPTPAEETSRPNPGPSTVVTSTLTTPAPEDAVSPGADAEQGAPAAVPVTVTVVVTVTAVATPTPTPTAGPPVVALPDDEVLTGTIIANRTPFETMFFLEGALYKLPPHRATGVQLARPLTALTLYNCEGGVEDPEACFWDPYPIRADGFYEIHNSAEEGQAATLILEEAVPPPLDQAWIQNRTGGREPILIGDSLMELANTEVIEVPVEELGVREVHLRHCLELAQQQVCEWPRTRINGGAYYALRSVRVPADLPGATVVGVSLEPVVLQPALMTPTPTPTPLPVGLFCQSQVPSLNVRSGPGLEYLVIGKIRQDNDAGGRFFVTGRNETNEWLAVDSQVVDGGWVVNFPRYVTCEGDTSTLPVAPVTDGRLAAPTPTPAPAVEAPPEESPTPEPEPSSGIPPGRALLIVHNAFEHDIRFTLDAATHGLPEGSPSEYDLKPGDVLQFLIFAGRVQFTASTPFRSSAGNAEFTIEEGATRELFLHFVPSTEDPKRWVMRYE